MKKVYALILSLFLFSSIAKSQVLISLLLGDKLNSDKLEFGLIGGLNTSNMSNIEGSSSLHSLHLGFYFDFILNDKFSFSPAVYVIGNGGIKYTNFDPNVTGVYDLDSLLVGANVERKIEYFQVPLLFKYNLTPRFHFILGPQLALRHKSNNYYTIDLIDDEDLLYTEDIRDNYKQLDAGFTAGIGYKLKPKGGMSLGIRYYQGLVDVLKDNPGSKQVNTNLNFYATIPIGKGKAEKKKAAESTAE